MQGQDVDPYPLLPRGGCRLRAPFVLSSRYPMKINAVEIRPGNIIEYEGGIWRAVKIQHHPARQGRRVHAGRAEEPDRRRKNNIRFRSAESLERVRLDTSISSICSATAIR